ncbi:hypothetical protein [Sporomusa acidovorans]|uniref:Rubredoxin-like domain-containing protein n=1 Tax=Sporomusa acidovorans (strain ATCC 49682 / DSM 3132 / Mol) TaxID=1123286 RepID=A0ABZ3IZ67_SPOA4|nr:hypothetical protein [Sporomusa acidovorans]OZC18329.1 hypothetical protein SPACI_34910 [Sporomusa acidovorans DSM 3132]SDF19840.1 hypothetical protein SAMN04488499_103718 [Sporomusa acidovorans]
MADTLYKCEDCGYIHEVEGGKKPDVCEKCGSSKIISIGQETGQFGCVGK